MKTSRFFEILAASCFGLYLFFFILALKSGNGEYEIVMAALFAAMCAVFLLLFNHSKNKEIDKKREDKK